METLVLAVGGAGGNIADQMKKRKNLKLMLADTDVFSHITNHTNKHLGYIGIGRGAKVQGYWNERNAISSLEQVISPYTNRVLVLAGLGGNVGTEGALFIANFARVLGASVLMAIIMPHHFEKQRRKLAERELNLINNAPFAVKVFENDNLIRFKSSQTGDKSIKQMNKSIAHQLDHWLRSLS